MKSFAAIEAVMIVGMAAIAATMFFQLPAEIEDLSKLTTLSSADAVATDIAGLISTSVSAPESITIKYQPPEGLTYSLSIKNKQVTVTAIAEEKPGIPPKTEQASAKIPVDVYVGEMLNVKTLEIKKTLENGKNKYEVKKIG